MLAAFALLANSPDIALFLTRPGAYGICHSALVNAAAMAPPLGCCVCGGGWDGRDGKWLESRSRMCRMNDLPGLTEEPAGQCIAVASDARGGRAG